MHCNTVQFTMNAGIELQRTAAARVETESHTNCTLIFGNILTLPHTVTRRCDSIRTGAASVVVLTTRPTLNSLYRIKDNRSDYAVTTVHGRFMTISDGFMSWYEYVLVLPIEVNGEEKHRHLNSTSSDLDKHQPGQEYLHYINEHA